jgi:hypothetical protein
MALVRRGRGAEMPQSFHEDPLMYQALSDGFLAPTQDIALASADWGIDFEVEHPLHGFRRPGFMAFGDRVRIEMLDQSGASIFGASDPQVVKYEGP